MANTALLVIALFFTHVTSSFCAKCGEVGFHFLTPNQCDDGTCSPGEECTSRISPGGCHCVSKTGPCGSKMYGWMTGTSHDGIAGLLHSIHHTDKKSQKYFDKKGQVPDQGTTKNYFIKTISKLREQPKGPEIEIGHLSFIPTDERPAYSGEQLSDMMKHEYSFLEHEKEEKTAWRKRHTTTIYTELQNLVAHCKTEAEAPEEERKSSAGDCSGGNTCQPAAAWDSRVSGMALGCSCCDPAAAETGLCKLKTLELPKGEPAVYHRKEAEAVFKNSQNVLKSSHGGKVGTYNVEASRQVYAHMDKAQSKHHDDLEKKNQKDMQRLQDDQLSIKEEHDNDSMLERNVVNQQRSAELQAAANTFQLKQQSHQQHRKWKQ